MNLFLRAGMRARRALPAIFIDGARLCIVGLSAFVLPHPAVAAIPASERAVLDAIYTQTQGQSWSDNSGWEGSAGGECNWHNVICDATGSHITQILLGGTSTRPGNHLVGTLPVLTALSQLVIFDVRGNQLNGSLPSLAGLQALQNFEASNNAFSGSIPAFAGNARLITYEVSKNQLSGALPAFDGAPALQGLFADGNQLSGSLPTLPASLQFLYLSTNAFSGTLPASIAQLSQLRNLDLSGNQFSGDVPSLASLTSLATLSLAHNAFSGLPPTLPPQYLSGVLCPNAFTHSPSIPWDSATQTTPWYKSCPYSTQSSTTTSLTASVADAVYGQDVEFSAQVSGHAPTGNVTFYRYDVQALVLSASPVLCDAVPLAGSGDTRSAACTVRMDAAAIAPKTSYVVTAVYGEDANNSASSSNNFEEHLALAHVTLTPSAPNGPVVGVPLTVMVSSAAVAPSQGVPSGGIDVRYANSDCEIQLPASQCTLVPAQVNANGLTAIYSGDGNFDSATATLSVPAAAKGSGTIAVTAGANPASTFGTNIFANVSEVGDTYNPGTISMTEDGTPLCTGQGSVSWTCATGTIGAGPHTIVATYAGDPSHNSFSSAPFALDIYDGSTTLIATLSTTTITAGQPVTINAAVSTAKNYLPPAALTGSITATVDTDSCVINAPSGSCSMTPTGTGARTIIVNYSGDRYYFAQSVSLPLTITGGATTTMSLTSSANPVPAQTAVVLRATVTGDAPAGTVEFLDGEVQRCAPVTLVLAGNTGEAGCLVSLSPGTHMMNARYVSSDARNAPASASLVQVVNATGEFTTLEISSSPSPSIDGQGVTLVASVTATTPLSGNVDFSEGDRSLCIAVPLVVIGNTGEALCVTTFTGVYTHNPAAFYRGDATHIGSGFGMQQVVTAKPPFDPDQFGLTGAWYSPISSSQGVLFELYPDAGGPGNAILGGGLFTWDPNGNAQWFTLQGTVARGSGTAQVGLFSPSTIGNFDAGPVIPAKAAGTATLRFGDCGHLTLDYAITDGTQRSGSMPLQRLGTNESCVDGNTTPSGTAPSYLNSGAWYNPSTSGQGWFFDFNPSITTLFGVWYTFAPAVGGTPAHTTWYTLQSNSFAAGTSQVMGIPIYQTTGGRFDAPAGTTTVPVGTANIDINCGSISLTYSLTAGSQAGHAGTTKLQPVGPTPAGCHP